MNLISIASIVLLAALAGCAAPGPSGHGPNQTSNQNSTTLATSSGSAVSAATDTRTPLEPQSLKPTAVPQLPGGSLQPLVADDGVAFPIVVPLTPPGDLWERIRRGYAMPNLENDAVHDREQWYSERPDYILRMAERSRKYLFHIVEELELRGMPSELALLPFIESAFNPQAVSTAKAAGMWQFMPATGKQFELKQNVFRDDRRDVIASTDAALNYLQKLYGMFGDWHLALAAYNWGEGNVGRAIAKNQRANLGTGYLDLSMPAETRMYVPKLQAMKNIVSAPDKYVTSFPLIGDHPYFQTVAITHDIDVALAAKLAQVQIDDFKALNPSVNRPVILAAGTPQVLLPWDNAAVFDANLRAYGAQLASWTVWRAPTSMRSTEAAKRVGMSDSDLRDVNRIPAGMVIKAGSTLLVTRSSAVRADVAEQEADNGQVSLGRPAPVRTSKSRSTGSRTKLGAISRDSAGSATKRSGSSAAKPGANARKTAPAAAPRTKAASPKKAKR